MVKEGTPGKYKLRARQEGSRQPLIEAYASRDEVDARKAALERAGYTVIVRLAETVREVLASRVQHSRQEICRPSDRTADTHTELMEASE